MEPPDHDDQVSAAVDAVEHGRRLGVYEPARVPWDAVILGWGPMLPFPAALLAVIWGGARMAEASLYAVLLWGAAIVIFLSGVRRGLSFRTPGGWRWAQMATFAWLFWAGLGSILLPPGGALWLLATAYASLAVLDPVAARREEVPLYFARLRPAQMAVPAICLALLAVIV